MSEIIYCPKCDMEEIPKARIALGYTTCMTCGEIDAKALSDKKRNRIAIAYPKGAYQYITDEYPLEDLG